MLRAQEQNCLLEYKLGLLIVVSRRLSLDMDYDTGFHLNTLEFGQYTVCDFTPKRPCVLQ